MKALVLSIPAALVSITSRPAYAQPVATSPHLVGAATAGDIQQLQTLHQHFPEPPNLAVQSSQPPIIPQLKTDPDDEGQISFFQVGGQAAAPRVPFLLALSVAICSP